jgi:DNA/RNA-binding domain of Phe-tRNA-synthetase-like protein
LSQFENVVIKDVSKDHEELVKWNDILKLLEFKPDQYRVSTK